MQGSNQVSTIVYGELGFIVQSSVDVLVICLLVLPPDGIDRDAIFHQGSGDIILGAQGVRGAENDIGSSLLQG